MLVLRRVGIYLRRLAESCRAMLAQYPALDRLFDRYGRPYWLIPGILRRRLVLPHALAALPQVAVLPFGQAETVTIADSAISRAPPTPKHRSVLGTRRLRQPTLIRLPRATLIGTYATPVTPDGRMALTPYRNEPWFLQASGGRSEQDFFRRGNGHRDAQPVWLERCCPMVSRVDCNYFHWLVEYAALLEGLLDHRLTADPSS